MKILHDIIIIIYIVYYDMLVLCFCYTEMFNPHKDLPYFIEYMAAF